MQYKFNKIIIVIFVRFEKNVFDIRYLFTNNFSTKI
ncbi:hypothetical protein SPPR111872_19950 [Sphingobacterium prati]